MVENFRSYVTTFTEQKSLFKSAHPVTRLSTAVKIGYARHGIESRHSYTKIVDCQARRQASHNLREQRDCDRTTCRLSQWTSSSLLPPNQVLAGIYDLQLMELATRSFSRRCVNGLSKCIERDAPMSIQERLEWVQTKEGGLRLFAPEKGGRYEVFNERPLPDAIKFYCAQDVQILPRLWAYYDGKMGQRWRERMIAESRARVQSSQSATYNGKGRHMALAPTEW
ncbi:hypothetical protein AU210_015569 [Fusarium oxysporum f. sp. radicis-cucumerinum]|uniref:Uncharacterized protein n=2 Tax=Fusarium oxysporum TaxID=5507 RepID=A0A2H3FST2_FUSOX|nr:hypothetical protein AU210_015569 [Fusarium oxysporum f. sp. radicis-cucumerinum]